MGKTAFKLRRSVPTLRYGGKCKKITKPKVDLYHFGNSLDPPNIKNPSSDRGYKGKNT